VRRRRVLAVSAASSALLGGVLTNVVTAMYPVPSGWRGWLTVIFVIVVVLACALAWVSVEPGKGVSKPKPKPTRDVSAVKPALRGSAGGKGDARPTSARDASALRTSLRGGMMGVAATATITLIGFTCSCSLESLINPPGSPLPPMIGECGLPDAPLALVVGRHANAVPPVVTAEVGDAVRYAIGVQRGLSIVKVDGDPAVVYRMTPRLIGRNDAVRQVEMTNWLAKISQAVGAVRPTEPESDPLGALRQAAGTLGDSGTIVVLDSGVSTVAPFDLSQPGAFVLSPDEVLGELALRHSLPDLAGKTIIFSNLGNVALPQQALGQEGRQHLKEIWQAILRAGGAKCVAFVSQPAGGQTSPMPDDFPTVRTISIAPSR
jgi:hypothetical protein